MKNVPMFNDIKVLTNNLGVTTKKEKFLLLWEHEKAESIIIKLIDSQLQNAIPYPGHL